MESGAPPLVVIHYAPPDGVYICCPAHDYLYRQLVGRSAWYLTPGRLPHIMPVALQNHAHSVWLLYCSGGRGIYAGLRLLGSLSIKVAFVNRRRTFLTVAIVLLPFSFTSFHFQLSFPLVHHVLRRVPHFCSPHNNPMWCRRSSNQHFRGQSF